MKAVIYSCVILSLIIFNPCRAMDNTIKKISHLREITAPEPIRAIAFLNKEKILLGTKKGCFITTTQDISSSSQVHGSPVSRIAVNHNRNKFITWHGGVIHSYDTETKEASTLSDLPLIYSAAFSPTDDTIFVHKNKTCISNCGKPYNLPSHLESEFDVGYHPTQKKIIYPNNNSMLTDINFEDSDPKISHLFISNLYPSRQVEKIVYNNDGSYLALIHHDYNTLHVTIYNSLSKSTYYLGTCRAIKFHPNNIIAVLVLINGTIDFWNIKTNERIMGKELFRKIPASVHSYPYDIDFSPNGLQFIILINTQCFIGMVPAKVYDTKTKERCILAWYMLKHFNHDESTALPQDIAQIIMSNLIEISQF